MNNRELRLGNWVDYKGNHYQIDDGIRNLSIDHLDSEELNSHLTNIKIKDLEGILLTEEVLLNCGFEEYMYKGDLRIPILNGVLMSVIIDEDFVEVGIGDEITLKKIKYLHQLQNLYFVLTGTELEIKL